MKKQTASNQLLRRCGLILLALSMLLTLFGCTKAARDEAGIAPENMVALDTYFSQNGEYDTTANEDGTPILVENPFIATQEEPISTFSADVDTASYANVRRMLLEGREVPADAVIVNAEDME